MVKANVNWNAKQIAKMVTTGTLKFDNAVQRGLVWDKKKKTLLIDTMLKGFPIPPVFTIKEDPVENEKGKMVSIYDCLDGKQRCNTIASFINDGFTLGTMDDYVTYENGDEADISGCLFSELDEELQDRILSCSLTVYFFTDITDEEICEMMARLNNGKSLTTYEFSRIKAKDLAGIQEVANHHLFDDVSNKGYAHEDIVIKSYAMLYTVDPCLDTKCIRPLIEELELADEEKELLNKCFSYINDAREYILNDDTDTDLNKRIGKKMLMKTHLISTVPVAYRATEDNVSAEDFGKFLQVFFAGEPSKSKAYNNACTSGSNHTANVKARNDAFMKEYEKFFAN